MDLGSFVRQLHESGDINRLATAQLAQFGSASRSYYGANILPERMVPENRGEEADIQYQSIIANDSTRYSPVQIKYGGQLVGSFEFNLGHQNLGRQISARDYDALVDLLGRNIQMQAAQTIMSFVDTMLVQPMVEVIEKQRWQALVNASVVREGDNGYNETVTYPNPSGHRVAAGGDWTSAQYDPIEDLFAIMDLLQDKGFRVNRIVTSRKVKTTLMRNAEVQKRFAGVRTLSDGDYFSRMNMTTLDTGLAAEGLPAIDTYDLTYRTRDNDEDGTPLVTRRFLPEDVMVFTAETGRDETLMLEDFEIQDDDEYRRIENTLGYSAIGRAVGQSNPGRIVQVEFHDDIPPTITGKAAQASLPIVVAPEAVAVIHTITTGA